MSDNLKKIAKDKDYINCNQEWEIVDLLANGYSEDAIKHCCKKDLGNNPRDKFIECLINYENDN